jgi:hypothetical protein
LNKLFEYQESIGLEPENKIGRTSKKEVLPLELSSSPKGTMFELFV